MQGLSTHPAHASVRKQIFREDMLQIKGMQICFRNQVLEGQVVS